MPGAEYQITCTTCQLPPGSLTEPTAAHPGEVDPDWPATLGEFFGERGGHDCRYCPECGFVGEQRHFFKLVCGDCGRRDRRFASMTTPPDRCACGGERAVQLVYGRTPACPEHPAVELVEMSLIELAGINEGITSIPCHRCGSGTLVVGGPVMLMD